LIEFPYAVAGLVVGIIVGLTGVGGGSLMTPLLVLGFGVPAITAVGTDLLFAAATKAGGALVHSWKRNVDWRVMRLLAAGSVPGTVLGIGALALLPPASPASRSLISITLGAMLLLTAASLVFRSRMLAWAAARSSWRHPHVPTIAAGAVIGFVVAVSSVGAGAVGVTALLVLFPGLAIARIVGTDIAHAVPITLIAGLGHAVLGNVSGWMLASLLVGSLPGIAAGSHLAARLPERMVRHALAAILVFAGGKLVAA